MCEPQALLERQYSTAVKNMDIGARSPEFIVPVPSLRHGIVLVKLLTPFYSFCMYFSFSIYKVGLRESCLLGVKVSCLW